MPVPAWAKGPIRHFYIFHDQALGSNLRFQNPEKLLEGEDIHVRPNCGSGFSRYRAMVNYAGVCSLANMTRDLATEAPNY